MHPEHANEPCAFSTSRRPAVTAPIGVFDSGVGGLTVLRAMRKRLPGEDFLYLGDTARLPYGTKSAESVTRYALQTTRQLAARGVKLLVVACNTASSVALEALAAEYPGLPVVGVVEPGARACCAATPADRPPRIAVVATESTVRGGAYRNAILRLRPDAVVESRPGPLFVALAEEGWTDGPLVEAIAERSLRPLLDAFGDEGPDCLVLGCTHFPLLRGAIKAVSGAGVCVVDSAETTAEAVTDLLKKSDMKNPAEGGGTVRFFATDGPERFARVGEIFLGHPIGPDQVTLVDL